MLEVLLWTVTCLVGIMTLLPLSNSARWWIRMYEFPRPHIGGIAFGTLLIALPASVAAKPLMAVILLAVVIYQCISIYPYTRFADTEVDLSDAQDISDLVSVLSVNVQMENTRYDDLRRIVRREDPDILFLMETDEVWHYDLEDILEGYTTVKTHLTDNYYGLIFATRLEAKSVELLWPNGDEIPMLKAVLHAPNGPEFNFIGVHPRPPVPGNDTASRDRQIKTSAQMTASSERPTVCMGDFNDVAWSWTSQRFKSYGGFVDPRVGRGMMSSFHAGSPLMRCPIDQLFITDDVSLAGFTRLEYFGSDHFPMKADVFFTQTKSGPPD